MYQEVLKKIKKIKKQDPFLITVTTYNKEGTKLDTFLFANNFPYADIEGSRKKINELIKKEKEKHYN